MATKDPFGGFSRNAVSRETSRETSARSSEIAPLAPLDLAAHVRLVVALALIGATVLVGLALAWPFLVGSPSLRHNATNSKVSGSVVAPEAFAPIVRTVHVETYSPVVSERWPHPQQVAEHWAQNAQTKNAPLPATSATSQRSQVPVAAQDRPEPFPGNARKRAFEGGFCGRYGLRKVWVTGKRWRCVRP